MSNDQNAVSVDLKTAIKIVQDAGFVVQTPSQAGVKSTATGNRQEMVSHAEVRAYFDSLTINDRPMTRAEIANAIGRTVSLISTVSSERVEGDKWSRPTFEAHKTAIEAERDKIAELENLLK